MRVLGIDPGLTRCGIGVVEGSIGAPLQMVAVGVILTSSEDPTESRLLQLEREIQLWITEFKPDVIAIERVFSQHDLPPRNFTVTTDESYGTTLPQPFPKPDALPIQ